MRPRPRWRCCIGSRSQPSIRGLRIAQLNLKATAEYMKEYKSIPPLTPTTGEVVT
jgi:hypothetical protein